MRDETGLKDNNNVNELIKSFEENRVGGGNSITKTDIEIPQKELKHSSSSKALELINKYIDVPEPQTEFAITDLNKENINPNPETEDTKKPDLIEVEMKELTKELEELKKEEERFEKTFITRQTSTSSLEEAFVNRLQERQYKVR